MTPSQAYRAALEAAADRVSRFADGGKYASNKDTEMCEHLAAVIRALPVPSELENP